MPINIIHFSLFYGRVGISCSSCPTRKFIDEVSERMNDERAIHYSIPLHGALYYRGFCVMHPTYRRLIRKIHYMRVATMDMESDTT